MKLYYAPGACSIGIHLLLEEIGKPYELQRLNFQEQEQYKEPFVSLNPKSKVPTLQLDDGSVLTEFPAISTYLARSNPEKGLLPGDPLGQARTFEAMDYIVATMHMQGFSRIFRPGNYAPTESDHEAVRARGREMFAKGFAFMDKALQGKEYLVGNFSIADCALFYVTFWAAVRLKMDLPANITAFWKRMQARPAVQRTLQQEGLAT